MSNLLKLRLGVTEDPRAFQPTLGDCLEAMLQQAQPLMKDVLDGLVAACDASSPRRIVAFQRADLRAAVLAMGGKSSKVCDTFQQELTRIVYQGGGKEQAHSEVLRYEDLKLFEDDELDQSIEVARAQQQVSLAVDDVLPMVDSLVSTLLGWRTVQPGLNPLRPDVFVRAMQSCLAHYVPDAAQRESLIVPAAGLLGANLRKLYKELAERLRSSGVEQAVPAGGTVSAGSGASGAAVAGTVARTLLTLARLRKLLAGDFDTPRTNDFLHTVPASLVALQDLKQVDVLVKRLEERPKESAPEPERERLEHESVTPRLGDQLGQEVVRLMFDTLSHDTRLMPEFKRQLKRMEPAVFTLAQHDSRFFSDRTHPARQFLDRITQRSLAFTQTKDDGWPRFLGTVEDAARWLDSKVVDADIFGELLDHLQEQWAAHDQVQKARREDAARALLHAEQRNLLAQKFAAEFEQSLHELAVAGFVADFLKGSWAQVVAEAQLSCADGSDDPYGYRALVDDLIWSVQKTTAQRGRGRRLAQMVPGLLAKLREGLARIDYPSELTDRFFGNLVTLHQSALQEGRDAATQAAADEIESRPGKLAPADGEGEPLWLASHEAQESGYVDGDTMIPDEQLPGPEPADVQPAGEAAAAGNLRTGTWVELMVRGDWMRVQLTWASPHAKLFMFTSLSGTAHSMSRRTLDKLRTQGLLRVLAQRNVVDDALDQVAKAALKNSLDPKE